jgi:RNA polymerase sigma factor (sigma-70 family)
MNFSLADIRTMLRFATRRTGFPVRDEDLEQEIALHAICAFRRLGHVSHPRALLMKIVQDKVHDYWRRRHSFEHLDSVNERLITSAPELEVTIDVRRRLDLLACALTRLPPDKRVLMELFYERELSIPEIARLQNKSVSAIKMELRRSRQALARTVRQLERNRDSVSRNRRNSRL